MIENLLSAEAVSLSKTYMTIEEFLKLKNRWKKFYSNVLYITNLDFSTINFNPEINGCWSIINFNWLSLKKIGKVCSKLSINLDIKDCALLFENFEDNAICESEISISYFKDDIETSDFLDNTLRDLGDEVDNLISLKEYLLLQSFYYYHNKKFLDEKKSTFLKPISLGKNNYLFLIACYDKETNSILITEVDYGHHHPTNGARLKQN
ncbi:MAG TPA: hypothetical protein PLE28_00955 [bacterium]|nr:hypothetical protein [bacterium]